MATGLCSSPNPVLPPPSMIHGLQQNAEFSSELQHHEASGFPVVCLDVEVKR